MLHIYEDSGEREISNQEVAQMRFGGVDKSWADKINVHGPRVISGEQALSE